MTNNLQTYEEKLTITHTHTIHPSSHRILKLYFQRSFKSNMHISYQYPKTKMKITNGIDKLKGGFKG